MQIDLQKLIGKGYKDFWNTKKRYRVVKGGRGSKKSTTTSIWYILNLMKYPDSNLLVLRKVFKDHRDSTFAQLKWAINKLNVSKYWHTTVSPLEMTYIPTGQKILFRGLDEPQSITSITVERGYLCWAWFEEFYQIANEDDFDKIDMSIRGDMPEPYFKQITGTLNPWNEKHWIKARFFDNPDNETFTLTNNYLCNEWLDESDKKLFDLMKERNPRAYKVAGLGEWGVAEGLIFENWEERNFNYQEIIKENSHLQSAFGLDFGYTTDPSGFICSLFDLKDKIIYVFDEHYQKGMLNNQIADMINYKGYSKEEIIADSAEPKSIEEIKRLGINRIKPARKGKDSIMNGIQFLQQFKMIIHPKCTNMILELNNYCFDEKDGKKINEPIDDYNHLIDPLRYSAEKFMSKGGVRILT